MSGLDFDTHVDYPLSDTECGDCTTTRLDGSLLTAFDSGTEITIALMVLFTDRMD